MRILLNHPKDGVDGHFIVVLGDAAMDVAITARLPMVPHATCCPGSTVRFKPGGSARNVAENLARLGLETRFLSVFGNDQPGRTVRMATRRAGVDISASMICADRTTTHCVVVSDHDGENYCCIGDTSIIGLLTPECVMERGELVRRAALIITNTTLSAEALACVFALRTEQPVFVDIIAVDQVDRVRPWLSQIHTLKLNREKASLLTGLPFSAREDAPAVADWVRNAGVKQVVLSLAGQGTYYSNGEQTGWLQRRAIQVVNATGAGDALMAGLAYGWLNHMPLNKTVRFALECSALTLSTLDNNYAGLTQERVLASME